MKYDYFEVMTEDVKDYIDNEVNLSNFTDRVSLDEYLNDTLWADDSVTGNASGSYTFNAYQAEENICHNLDLLAEAMSEFGCNENASEKGAEWCDVTIRCYLLPQVISSVLDDMEEELDAIFEEQESEEE